MALEKVLDKAPSNGLDMILHSGTTQVSNNLSLTALNVASTIFQLHISFVWTSWSFTHNTTNAISLSLTDFLSFSAFNLKLNVYHSQVDLGIDNLAIFNKKWFWPKSRLKSKSLRVVLIQAIYFLKSMSEKVGSDIDYLWNSMINFKIDSKSIKNYVIQIQSRSLSDPTLSDIDVKK